MVWRPELAGKKRPKYWSDRFSATMPVGVSDTRADETVAAVRAVEGVASVRRQKRFLQVHLTNGAKLASVMKRVRAIDGIESAERSGIVYPAGS